MCLAIYFLLPLFISKIFLICIPQNNWIRYIKRKKKNVTQKFPYDYKNSMFHPLFVNRRLTKENTLFGITSPNGFLKSPIGYKLSNWGLVICTLNMHYQTHISPIPNWILSPIGYYPQLWFWNPQLGIVCSIEDIVC